MIRFLKNADLEPFVRDYLSTDRFSMRATSGGLLNQNMVVTAAKEKLLLKVYRPKIDDEKVREIHRMMRHCANAGIPVPSVLTQKMIGGFHVVLCPFILGEHPSRFENNNVRIKKMGEMLASVELALKSFRSRAEKPTSRMLANWDPEGFLKEIGSIRRGLRSHPVSLRREVGHDLDVTQRIVERGDWSAKHFLALPVRLIHGDYHIKNILFRKNKIVAVLDWEKAEWNWLGFEVGRSIMFNCRRNKGTINWSLAETYVKSYRRVYGPWTDLERALAFECGFRKLLFSLWAIKAYVAGDRDMRTHVDRRIALTQTLADHRDEYAERLANFLV